MSTTSAEIGANSAREGDSAPTVSAPTIVNAASDDDRSSSMSSFMQPPLSCTDRLQGVKEVVWAHRHGLLVGTFGFASNLSTTFISPFLPQMKQDYFGTAQRAALMNAIFDTVTATIGFLLAGLYARMLNAYGRRPFFLVAALATIATNGAFAIGGSNPIPYMAVSHVGQLVIASYATAYVADTVAEPATRVRCFALYVVGSVCASLPGIAVATTSMSRGTGAWIALGLSVLPLLWAVLVLRESLPAEQRVPMTLVGLSNPMSGVGIIVKYRLLRVVVAVLILASIADTGVGELLLQYLIDRLHLTPADFAVLSVEAALLSPISLFIVFPVLLRLMSAPMTLTVLVTVNGVVLVLIATVWAKWVIYAVIMPVTTLLIILTPLLNGIVSNSTDVRSEQALRLTAIAAVNELVGAVAPLPMTLLFAELPPSMLSLPFFVGAGLLVSGGAVALLIPRALAYDIRMEAEAEAAKAAGGVAEALFAEEEGRAASGPLNSTGAASCDEGMVEERTQARLRAVTLVEQAATPSS